MGTPVRFSPSGYRRKKAGHLPLGKTGLCFTNRKLVMFQKQGERSILVMKRGEEDMGIRKSEGNMYGWVTHVHAELGGECAHKCSYCYVNNRRFGRAARYCGEMRIIEKERGVELGRGKVIFKEHMNDLFAEGVSGEIIQVILDHCKRWPGNTYVFQKG